MDVLDSFPASEASYVVDYLKLFATCVDVVIPPFSLKKPRFADDLAAVWLTKPLSLTILEFFCTTDFDAVVE